MSQMIREYVHVVAVPDEPKNMLESSLVNMYWWCC